MVKNILQRKKSQPNLFSNRFYGKKYTSKEKKSTTFIFKEILNTVFRVFLKIDTRSQGKQKWKIKCNRHADTVCQKK